MKREKIYHYTYRIDNLINGKYYYGKHSAESLDNDYMGSGKLIIKAIDKWGIENFKKTILKTFPTSEEAFAHEAEIVTQKEVDDPMCYNIALGGYGGNLIAGYSEEEREVFCKKLSDSHKGQVSHMKGKHMSSEARQKISIANKGKMVGENHPMYGKKHSEKTRQQLSESHKGIPSPRRISITVTDLLPLKHLEHYGLQTGDIFDSISSFIEITGIGKRTPFRWIDKGWLTRVGNK